ncbi:Receptor expression-enhancing protein, partial [Trichostrongylus colubriformis]
SYWSKYWAVFGSFLAVDVVLSSLFVHYFIPFYEFGKLLFLLWAVCPQTAGAQFVFDKVLAPFIRRHEKNMDVYIERAVSSIVNHGPEMAMTAGMTLLTLAKNLHTLSLAKADANGRLCLPAGQPSVDIAEIVEEEEAVPLNNAIEAPLNAVEVKAEPIDPYVEEVVYMPMHQERDESKSASTTKTNLPAKRRRGRRPGSGVTTRRKKQRGNAEGAEDDPKFLTVVDVVDGKPVRPRSTRAAARNKLVIVGDDDSGSEA